VEDDKPDFEKHQYGNYVLLPFANAAAESIEAAKALLMSEYVDFIPEEYLDKIIWTVSPQYKCKIGRKFNIVTSVGWKLGPIKKEI
jgi:hypothetical protein